MPAKRQAVRAEVFHNRVQVKKETEMGQAKKREERIRRESAKAVSRNMAGMTDQEAREYCDGQPFGCLAAAACAAALALIAVGWVIYAVCCRHPLTGSLAQPLGWAGWAFGTAAAAAKIGR
jgi:hypothetical protein